MMVTVRCTHSIQDSHGDFLYEKDKIYEIPYVNVNFNSEMKVFIMGNKNGLSSDEFYASFEEVNVNYILQYNVIESGILTKNLIEILDSESDCQSYLENLKTNCIYSLRNHNCNFPEVTSNKDHFIISSGNSLFIASYKKVVSRIK